MSPERLPSFCVFMDHLITLALRYIIEVQILPATPSAPYYTATVVAKDKDSAAFVCSCTEDGPTAVAALSAALAHLGSIV